MLVVLELVFTIAFVVFLITQVMIPAICGRPLLPMFSKKSEIEHELTDVAQAEDELELANELAEKKARLAYKSYRKGYCENLDGRLGFECENTHFSPEELVVDHIDGNAANNLPENLQTICKQCLAKRSNSIN